MNYWIKQKQDFKQTEVDTLIIGFFDGVHAGHMKLKNAAKSSKITILTFNFIKSSSFLHQIDERLQILEKTFNPQDIFILDLMKLNMSSDEFIEIVKKCWNPKQIIVGSDFKFGRDLSNIKKLQETFNTTVIKRSRYFSVSTTKIKKLLKNNKFKKVNNYLIVPYSIKNIVVHGKGLARNLGFRTANFKLQNNEININSGVYITKSILNNITYNSITFIGKPITFKDSNEIKFETHLINYNGPDFYQKKLEVVFIKKIGNVKKYKSIQKLINGINKQVKLANNFFNK